MWRGEADRYPALLLAALLIWHAPLDAQSLSPAQQTVSESTVVAAAKFLAGGAAGLVMHESGHVIVDFASGTTPGLRSVSYAGIPFFAITHDPVTDGREFAISSAGFWVQHATSEWLLSTAPIYARRTHRSRKGCWLSMS
jgi:hypothetical protein